MPVKVDGASGPNRPNHPIATAKPAAPKAARPVVRAIERAEDRDPADQTASFEADATAVLLPLQTSLRFILDALPGRMDRSTDLQRALGTDPKLAWQVYKFVHAPAVVPASSSLPGAVAMQRFYKLSAKKGVDKALVDVSQQALKQFEHFVTERAGDRRAFNTMAGGGRNDGQATNLAHKKAAFRAAAHFLGVETDVVAISVLVHRSQTNPGNWDIATLIYKIGVRRLRPDARIMLAHVSKSFGNPNAVSNDSVPRFEPIEPDVDPNFVATLLPPFCSNAKAEAVVKHDQEDYVEMEVAAGSVGTTGASNWAFGVVERNSVVEMYPGGNVLFHANNTSAAVQALIFDVYFDTGFELEPSTKVLTYVHSNSSTKKGDFARSDYKRLNLNETIVAMGRGDVAAERSELPRYNELVRYACDRLGWDLKNFRAYRCRVDYPMLGTGIDLHFDYPAAAPESK